MNTRIAAILITLLVVSALWASESAPSTIKGYVLDSACAFTRNVKKPISPECATACAKAGSPLVILADDGTIYWPISKDTPAAGQNERLLPFAGQYVEAKGEVFARGGSRALAIQSIKASAKAAQPAK